MFKLAKQDITGLYYKRVTDGIPVVKVERDWVNKEKPRVKMLVSGMYLSGEELKFLSKLVETVTF